MIDSRTLVVLVAVGCGSGNGSPSTNDAATDGVVDPNDARPAAAFDDVHPILLAKCSACHSVGDTPMNITKFVSLDLAVTYNAITSQTALVGNFTASTAPVLTKLTPMHQALTYTAAESAAITTWLDDEVATRFPATVNSTNTETPSEVTLRLMTQYRERGCVTQNFEAANMAQQVGGWRTTATPTQPVQECDNCHATAGWSFLASRDGTFFRDNLPKHNALIAQYYIVDLSSGVANARVIVNTANFERVASRQGPHVDHLPFDVSASSAGLQAIVEAYVATPSCAGPN